MEKWKNAKNIAKNEKKLKNVKKCKKNATTNAHTPWRGKYC